MDLWAVGCIFAYLLGAYPLFQGRNWVDQIRQIISVLGTPSREDVWGWPRWLELGLHNLPIITPRPLAQQYPQYDKDTIELLSFLLQFTPRGRYTATQALNLPYFHSVRTNGIPTRYEQDCPAIFNTTFEGITDVANVLALIGEEFRLPIDEICDISDFDSSPEFEPDHELTSGHATIRRRYSI